MFNETSSGQSTIPDVLAYRLGKRLPRHRSGQSTIPDVLAYVRDHGEHAHVPVRARFPMC